MSNRTFFSRFCLVACRCRWRELSVLVDCTKEKFSARQRPLLNPKKSGASFLENPRRAFQGPRQPGRH